MTRRRNWTPSVCQKLPLETFSLEALNSVLEMREAYNLQFQAYQEQRANTEAEKKSLRAAISSARQKTGNMDSEILQLKKQLAPFEVGVIGKWLFAEPTIQLAGRNYRSEAQPLIERWGMLFKRRNELADLQEASAKKLYDLESRYEYEPTKERKLRFRSQTFTFDVSEVGRERVERIIDRKKSKTELQAERERIAQAKLGQTKAKAAAYENKQRELAKSIRSALQRQLKEHPYCPYCQSALSFEIAHADHIHPVVKGGLSTIRNMVFVCQPCNIEKGTLTLRAFLKRMGYTEAEVFEHLEMMDKDV